MEDISPKIKKESCECKRFSFKLLLLYIVISLFVSGLVVIFLYKYAIYNNPKEANIDISKEDKIRQLQKLNVKEVIKELDIDLKNVGDLPENIVPNKIVVEKDQKIYLVDSKSRQAEVISDGYGINPSVSPDSKKVAYLKVKPSDLAKDTHSKLFVNVEGFSIYDLEEKNTETYNFGQATTSGNIYWLSNEVFALEMIADPTYYAIYTLPEFKFITYADNFPHYVEETNSLIIKTDGSVFSPVRGPHGLSILDLNNNQKSEIISLDKKDRFVETIIIDKIENGIVYFRKEINELDSIDKSPGNRIVKSTKNEYWQMKTDGTDLKEILPYSVETNENEYTKFAEEIKMMGTFYSYNLETQFLQPHNEDWAYYLISDGYIYDGACSLEDEVLVLANIKTKNIYEIGEGNCFRFIN